jgi:hypothetical protein
MKKIKLLLAGLLIVPTLAVSVSVLSSTNALADVSGGVGGGISSTNTGNVPEALDGDEGMVKKVVNVMLYAIGIIAVVMIIFGGIKYSTSAGDSNKVTSAKNTLLYAVVGLVVAIFAYAIVNWVFTQTSGS